MAVIVTGIRGPGGATDRAYTLPSACFILDTGPSMAAYEQSPYNLGVLVVVSNSNTTLALTV